MDWPLLLLLAIAVIALLIGAMWRPPRGRARTPEEHLEQAALRAEQDRTVTDATFRADRYNLRN